VGADVGPAAASLEGVDLVAGRRADPLAAPDRGRAGYGVYSLADRFQGGAFSCLPADFPSYRGTHVVTEGTRMGPGLPARTTHECRMILETNDDVTVVGAYFNTHLNSGD